MIEHTKGPWTVEAVNSERLHDICLDYPVPAGGNPILVATVFGDDDLPPIDNREASANARLIAAAPDLLAVCKALLDPLRANTLKEVIRMAGAAVARATLHQPPSLDRIGQRPDVEPVDWTDEQEDG